MATKISGKPFGTYEGSMFAFIILAMVATTEWVQWLFYAFAFIELIAHIIESNYIKRYNAEIDDGNQV